MPAPRIPRFLLARLLPPDRREFVMGDLEEDYERVAAARGRRAARRWYWREALGASLGRTGPVPARLPAPRGDRFMTALVQDLRFAIRLFARAPGFTAVVLVTLAIGIGANTAIFTVLHGVILRPLPYDRPEQLVRLAERVPGTSAADLDVSPANALDWRARVTSLDGVALVFPPGRATLGGADLPDEVIVQRVSADFFRVLRAGAALGRTIGPEDARAGSPPAAVFSHDLWRGRFAADPSVVGRAVRLDGRATTVVGVMRPGFAPALDADRDVGVQVWVPFDAEAFAGGLVRRARAVRGIARVNDDVTVRRAQAELAAVAADLARQHPEANAGVEVRMLPLDRVLTSGVRPVLWLLAGAVAFVLLVACVNVANLVMAHLARRDHEIAVRVALGAGRARIVRQLLTETVLLSAAGGALGLALATSATRLLLARAPATMPRLGDVGFDGAVGVFATGVSLLVGIACGLSPAVRHWGRRGSSALRQGAVTSTGRRRAGGRALVAIEVSLTLVLLAGAGLVLKSLWRVLDVEPGFDRRNLLALNVLAPRSARPDMRADHRFLEDLRDRVAHLPGVDGAAIGPVPLRSNSVGDRVRIPGAEDDLPVGMHTVSDAYFDVVRARVIAGRAFREADGPGGPRVAVVNETLARRLWPDATAVGRTLELRRGRPEDALIVVGVVGDMKQAGLDASVQPDVFRPARQNPAVLEPFVIVRAAGDPRALVGAIREVLFEADPERAAGRIATVDDVLSESVSHRQFIATLLVVFAVLALALAAVGLSGLVATFVSHRTREIAIRLALGARVAQVMAHMLAEVLAPLAVGVLLGLAGALGLTRLLSSQLFEVTPTDPSTLAAACAVLLAVGLLACAIPTRRITYVDPAITLRAE